MIVKQGIVKFIGFSGSGKTTLIEKIVKQLSAEGVRVATIKHDVHGLQIDMPNKDSYRYSAAGASISVVSSPDMTVYKVHKSLTLEEIISNIKEVDIIIIEGYSVDESYPTISVARKETNKGVKGEIDKLVAIVSDYNDCELNQMGYNCKMYNLSDIDEIINFIKTL